MAILYCNTIVPKASLRTWVMQRIILRMHGSTGRSELVLLRRLLSAAWPNLPGLAPLLVVSVEHFCPFFVSWIGGGGENTPAQ